MTVFVDNARIEWRGNIWFHLVADTAEELHEFARKLGLKRNWFQGSASYPHYDISATLRATALRIGAVEASRTQMIEAAKAMKRQLNRTCAEPHSLQLLLIF